MYLSVISNDFLQNERGQRKKSEAKIKEDATIVCVSVWHREQKNVDVLKKNDRTKWGTAGTIPASKEET